MATSTARLEVVGGRATGMSIEVSDELLIGRAAEGAGKLADDEEISRSHARLTVDSSGFCAIEDLGSTNGTFVNGLRISAPQALSVGDTIEIGESTLVVREVPTPAAAEPAPASSEPQATVVPGTPPVQPMATQPLEPADVPAPLEEPPDEPASEPDSGAREDGLVAQEVEAVVVEEAEAIAAEDAQAPSAEEAAVAADAPAATPAQTLSLRLELNFENREVRVLVDDDRGAWRARTDEPRSESA